MCIALLLTRDHIPFAFCLCALCHLRGKYFLTPMLCFRSIFLWMLQFVTFAGRWYQASLCFVWARFTLSTTEVYHTLFSDFLTQVKQFNFHSPHSLWRELIPFAPHLRPKSFQCHHPTTMAANRPHQSNPLNHTCDVNSITEQIPFTVPKH